MIHENTVKITLVYVLKWNVSQLPSFLVTVCSKCSYIYVVTYLRELFIPRCTAFRHSVMCSSYLIMNIMNMYVVNIYCGVWHHVVIVNMLYIIWYVWWCSMMNPILQCNYDNIVTYFCAVKCSLLSVLCALLSQFADLATTCWSTVADSFESVVVAPVKSLQKNPSKCTILPGVVLCRVFVLLLKQFQK